MPELTAFFSSGSLVESVLNMGLPAPIDVQIAGSESPGQLQDWRSISREQIRQIPGVADVFIPQDLD